MAKLNHETDCHTLKLWRGEGFADLFLERRVPEGGEGFSELAVISVVPRTKAERIDLRINVDELEKLARWIADYALAMRASVNGPARTEAKSPSCRV